MRDIVLFIGNNYNVIVFVLMLFVFVAMKLMQMEGKK